MRKVVKGFKLMLIMILMISLTGCVKLNTTMMVTKEDVKISSIVAIQDSMIGQDGVEEPNQEDMENYKKAGYTVEKYKQDGYTGLKLTKSLGSLESLSTDKKTDTIDLSGLLTGEDASVKKLFYLEKDTYYANFSFDTDSLTSDLEDEMNTDDTEDDFFTNSDEDSDVSTDQDMSGLLGDDFDPEQLMNMFDLKFEVTLPSEAIKHNATKVSDDKKTLTWDLTKTDKIEFSFQTNGSSAMMTYIIIGSIALLVIAAVVIIIITNNKKKKNMQNFTPNTPVNPMQAQPMNNRNQPIQPVQNQIPNQTINNGQNNK